MKIKTTLVYLSCLAGCIIFSASVFGQIENYTQYVNPFIGTTGGGNTFPGAALPFGMVKVGPDCQSVSNSGYTQHEAIKGFSHVHVSGTGGAPKYGNVLVMPFCGALASTRQDSEAKDLTASPGFFSAFLSKPSIRAEMTVTHSVAIHQYTYPKNQTAGLLIDAGHFLAWPEVPYETQSLVGSEIEILSPTEIRGYNRVKGGWNIGEAYTVYFYIVLNAPMSTFGSFKDGVVFPNEKSQSDNGKPCGAYMNFKKLVNDQLQMKVGISFISSNKAKANIMAEATGWSFGNFKKQADARWNSELSRVNVKGGTAEAKKLFYTSLYFTLLMPTDRTHENPKWTSDIPYFDDFYTIWDTFRATQPLRTLLMPSLEVKIANCLLDIYKQEGYMPDGRSGNYNGRTQGGSNADVLFADWYSKGIAGIDYAEAYEAMKKNAEIAPGGDEQKEGRGALDAYTKLGYVPMEYEPEKIIYFPPIYNLYERAGSRTLEYAYCDFALSVVAKGLNKNDEHERYKARSANWKNLWKDTVFKDVKGFIWPRNKSGKWLKNFSPLKDGSWGNFFYESTSWEYSFYVPQDMAGLIETCGGHSAFEKRLDVFFENGYFNIYNEPGFLVPSLYNYVGKPHKTAKTVNKLLTEKYKATDNGLPGNDDAGSMTAWFAFHSMGFFPVAGQDLYLISSPLFSEVKINLENGKTFVIKANNLSAKNIFVQSAKLNGKVHNQSWFTHTAIKDGGVLDLSMTDLPSDWGKDNLPPTPFR